MSLEEELNPTGSGIYNHLIKASSPKENPPRQVAQIVASVAADIANERPIVWKYEDKNEPHQFMNAVEEAFKIALVADTKGIHSKSLVHDYIEGRLDDGNAWLRNLEIKRFVGSNKQVYTGQTLMEEAGLGKIELYPSRLHEKIADLPQTKDAMTWAIEVLAERDKKQAERATTQRTSSENQPEEEKPATIRFDPHARKKNRGHPGSGHGGKSGA